MDMYNIEELWRYSIGKRCNSHTTRTSGQMLGGITMSVVWKTFSNWCEDIVGTLYEVFDEETFAYYDGFVCDYNQEENKLKNAVESGRINK